MHKFLVLSIFLFFNHAINGQAVEANLLGQWSNDTLVAAFPYDNVYNEIWGLKINGIEYAVIGSTQGTHFIDISDPTRPEEKFFVEGRDTGSNIIHRDYHDYNGYLYAVSDEGQSSLQIIDISNLPDSVSVVYDKNTLLRRTHNIFIDSATAKLYTLATKGGTSNSSAMRIFDISNPVEPVLLDERNAFGTYSIGHVHDAFVKNDTAYLNCGPDGLVIADFSISNDPKVLSILTTADYPQAGYNHSGWLSEDGRYYFMADETHGTSIKVFDLEDILNPKVIATLNAESSDVSSIPHNLIVKCDLLYVSYYYDGLQIFDISQKDDPQRISYYDTYLEPAGFSYKGAWGVYPFLPSGNVLISDMQTGLYIFSPPVQDVCSSQSTSFKNETKEADIKIWPSLVTDDQINIEIQDPNIEIETIALLNANGQRIATFPNISGDLFYSIGIPSNVSAGIYFLYVKTNSSSKVQKVIIQ